MSKQKKENNNSNNDEQVTSLLPEKSPIRGKNRAKLLPYHHNYNRIIKYKPFHCKVPGCTRRFKRPETLALHQDTHNNKRGWERRDEIQQGIADRSHTFDYTPHTHNDGSDPFLDAKYGRKGKSILFYLFIMYSFNLIAFVSFCMHTYLIQITRNNVTCT